MYITTTARSGTVRKNMDTAGRILFPSSSWFIPYCDLFMTPIHDSSSAHSKCKDIQCAACWRQVYCVEISSNT